MDINSKLVSLCFALFAFVTAICITYYHVEQNNAMKINIESAIVKGIDPLAVRCAYAVTTDQLCLAYAIAHGKDSISAPVVRK